MFFNKLSKLAHKISIFFNRLTTTANKIKNSVCRAKNFGGILIEFAFSIPVLIILLYFVHDHYRLYELKSKLRTSAYLAASMVQQISNTRNNKKLTIADLKNIAYASCLNLFHNKSMFDPWPLGIFFIIDFDWIKKIDTDKYQRQRIWAGTDSTTISNMLNGSSTATQTLSQYKTTYPELVPFESDWICDKIGDERLIINCYFRPKNFDKSKLGLFIANPIFGTYDFGYHLVITPKPGLFPI